MDYAFKGGVLFVNVSAIQALALAVLTYYFGVWVKKHVSILEKYSIPSPVVGGILFSIVLSILDGMNIMKVHFDSSLQTLLMLAFYTTIGLMASLKLIKKGGTLLVSFFIAVSVLVVLQNLVGMTIAQAMGLDKHYGILAGSVSMMGGLGTAAAFGPFFEHTYGVTGGTAVGITAATFGMVAALVLGGPFGEWVIHRYKIQTPKQPHEPEEKLMLPSDTEVSITSEQRANTPTFTDELMRAGSIVALWLFSWKAVFDAVPKIVERLPLTLGLTIAGAFLDRKSVV